MNEQDVQIIEKDGEPEYAVVPIEEYRRMVAVLEDAADSAAIERAWAEDAAGETISGEVVKAILAGESPLRVWRKHRGCRRFARWLARAVWLSRLEPTIRTSHRKNF